MKNRSRKCSSCRHFNKIQDSKREELKGICDLHDCKVDTSRSGCKEWKGTVIPTRNKA